VKHSPVNSAPCMLQSALFQVWPALASQITTTFYAEPAIISSYGNKNLRNLHLGNLTYAAILEVELPLLRHLAQDLQLKVH
jgi:hypothetical protein